MTIWTGMQSRAQQWMSASGGLMHGLLVSAMVAVCAQFLSEHYGAPAMLMALLLGMALNFLAEEDRCAPGIDFTAKKILRIGVALLGARISVEMLANLGGGLILLVVISMIATILFALLGARLLGRGWRLALLTGGSVAICGVSAAMAIAAVLPKNEHSERNLLFTVLSVTILSTIAMIAYPIIGRVLGLDDQAIGVFIGATIHDVAQVVGAGFSISDSAGETATLVKLIRVSMLAPTVLVLALLLRDHTNPAGSSTESAVATPPLIPGFVLAFLILAAVNSLGLIPGLVATLLGDISRWALLIAIAAVGMKSSLKTMFDVGGHAVILIVSETIFIALFILAGIYYLA